MRKTDVVVIGAGMVGASCALSLARHGKLTVTLIDNASACNAMGDEENANIRVSALGQASVQFLSELGVWQALPHAFFLPYQHMRIWDEMNDAELAFDAAEVGSQQLGYIVDNRALVYTLQKAVSQCSNIQTFYSESAAHISQNGNEVILTLASGEQLQSRLLVAADGANSWVRKALEIPATEFKYQQQAIVVKIATEFSHQRTAWQRYLSSGPVALLPVFDHKGLDNQCSIVWSTEMAESDRLMSLSNHDFAVELQHAVEGRLGKIELLSDRLSFPLQSNIASRYVEGAVVLVGDAAHRIHPMAGQGVNLGFKDVITLQNEVLLAHETNRSISSRKILRRYERTRKLDNQLTDKAMTSLYHVFGSQSPSFAMLRGLGVKALNRSSAIKNQLAKQAMGI